MVGFLNLFRTGKRYFLLTEVVNEVREDNSRSVSTEVFFKETFRKPKRFKLGVRTLIKSTSDGDIYKTYSLLRNTDQDIKKLTELCVDLGLPECKEQGSICHLPDEAVNWYHVFLFDKNKKLKLVNGILEKCQVKEFLLNGKVSLYPLKSYNQETIEFNGFNIKRGHDGAIAVEGRILDEI